MRSSYSQGERPFKPPTPLPFPQKVLITAGREAFGIMGLQRNNFWSPVQEERDKGEKES